MTVEQENLTPVTAHEVRLCRDAVLRTLDELFCLYRVRAADFSGWEGSRMLAARLYPMPTVEVPRVVESGDGWAYRMVNGTLQQRPTNGTEWVTAHGVLERTHAVNKVLASPTKQVPADEVDNVSA